MIHNRRSTRTTHLRITSRLPRLPTHTSVRPNNKLISRRRPQIPNRHRNGLRTPLLTAKRLLMTTIKRQSRTHRHRHLISHRQHIRMLTLRISRLASTRLLKRLHLLRRRTRTHTLYQRNQITIRRQSHSNVHQSLPNSRQRHHHLTNTISTRRQRRLTLTSLRVRPHRHLSHTMTLIRTVGNNRCPSQRHLSPLIQQDRYQTQTQAQQLSTIDNPQ